MRRNRMTAFSRRLVAETRLDTADLIWPLFVIEGQNMAEPIDAMPGVFRYSIDQLLQQAAKAVELTIPAIAIFPSIDAALKMSLAALPAMVTILCAVRSALSKPPFPILALSVTLRLIPLPRMAMTVCWMGTKF
jgi:porphobilinogen synthase